MLTFQCCLFADTIEFTSASAMFKERGSRRKNVPGYLLDNGNFIFIWSNRGYYKMVLTSNQGTQLHSGYVRVPSNTWEKLWKDSSTWALAGGKADYYTIADFQGRGK